MVMPSAFRVNEKPASTTMSPAVITQVMRGRRPTPDATLDHTPERRSSASSSRGTLGQNAQRPEGKRSRLKGPHAGRTMRMMPKITQPTMVMSASTPPIARNGTAEMSVSRLSTRPITAGTMNARIGKTTLGITRRAGRNVSMTTSAAAMPAAPTGPVERLELSSLSSRHMRPTLTVAALAMIGSATPRSAAFMASVCRAK